MNPDTAQQLIELNRRFYEAFAVDFSATRQRLQPGVQRLLPRLLDARRILDLGCGNGELARRLRQNGFSGSYLGLDFSAGLLEHARRQTGATGEFDFRQADLSSPGWSAGLPPASFDLILAFAVFHHLPGADLRSAILLNLAKLLSPGGLFIHSHWQFLHSPRLSRRIQPWNLAGIPESQLDPGDYLLDWRRGGAGLRYGHHFSSAELALLAAQTGFTQLQSFVSDGQEGSLALYQVWQFI